MNEFVSTYQKDFNWPYVRTFPIRSDRQPHRTPIKTHCICGSEPGGAMAPREYVGPIDGENYQWSRLGPMAPLLDPKLYPAKVGPAPEFEITRHDQPNTYLKKLQERYPYLYNVLQSAPPDELIRRVNEDRLKTTYQMDFSHMDEHPSADYEKLLARAGVSVCSKMRYSPTENLPILDCRTRLRPPDYEAPVQPTSMTIEILGSKDAGGFPMGDREVEYRDVEYDPEVNEGDPHRNDYDHDDPGGRTHAPRNGAKRFDRDRHDRGGSPEGKHTGGGTRETPTRENGSKGDRSSGSNAPKAKSHGGRNDRGGGNRGSRAPDAADAPGSSRANEATGEGGGGRVHETGGVEIRKEAEGSGETGGGRPSKKSEVGFGQGENERISKKSRKAKEEEEASKKPLPPWRSEYQDVIGQTGTHIIKDKLHHHGVRSGERRLMERVIMKCRT